MTPSIDSNAAVRASLDVSIASSLASAQAAGKRRADAPVLAPGQETISSTWRATVRLLQSLPLIRNMETVKAWAAGIANIDDVQKERLASLNASLVQRFGVEAAARAMDITQLNTPQPLSARTVKAAHEVAAAHTLRQEASDYANHAQLEVWARHGRKRFGHVALSVSHAMLLDNTVSKSEGWKSDQEYTYMSWFPSELRTVPEKVEGAWNTLTAGLRTVIKRIAHANKPVSVPTTSESYEEDMRYQTGEATNQRLRRGEFMPRANQQEFEVERRDGKMIKKWGTHADSRLAVPLMGDNYSRKSHGFQFAFFGLNERDLREKWQSMTHADNSLNRTFDVLSPGENCAGTVTKVLESAGANALLPLPKATLLQDPNEMDRYGRELMSVVAELNGKAAAIDETFRPLRTFDPEGRAAAIALEIPLPEESPEACLEHDASAAARAAENEPARRAAPKKPNIAQAFALPGAALSNAVKGAPAKPANLAASAANDEDVDDAPEENAARPTPPHVPKVSMQLPEVRSFLKEDKPSRWSDYHDVPATPLIGSLEARLEGTDRAMNLRRQIDALETSNALLFKALRPLRPALVLCEQWHKMDFETATMQAKALVNALHPFTQEAINPETLTYLLHAHALLITLFATCNTVSRFDKVAAPEEVAAVEEEAAVEPAPAAEPVEAQAPPLAHAPPWPP